MSLSPNDHDLRPEQADAVWRLLDAAPLPEPDAWFAARTLARCRNDVPAASGFFFGVWRWALGGGLAIITALFCVLHTGSPATAVGSVPSRESVQAAFEVVASLDSDTSSEPTPWPDHSP